MDYVNHSEVIRNSKVQHYLNQEERSVRAQTVLNKLSKTFISWKIILGFNAEIYLLTIYAYIYGNITDTVLLVSLHPVTF